MPLQTVPTPKTYTKAPGDTLDYSIDLAREMRRFNDTLSTVEWVVPSNMVDSAGNTSISLDDGVDVDYGDATPAFSSGVACVKTTTTAVIWLRGGTMGTTYRIDCRIVTTAGRKYQRTFYILIDLRSGV